ncbi:hypothetical protein CKA32_003227 [Geitlerinema sp. FC II]|nr:hypothetical protein CKA32_003227 [Geitlerinema sp. FC II]
MVIVRITECQQGFLLRKNGYKLFGKIVPFREMVCFEPAFSSRSMRFYQDPSQYSAYTAKRLGGGEAAVS